MLCVLSLLFSLPFYFSPVSYAPHTTMSSVQHTSRCTYLCVGGWVVDTPNFIATNLSFHNRRRCCCCYCCCRRWWCFCIVRVYVFIQFNKDASRTIFTIMAADVNWMEWNKMPCLALPCRKIKVNCNYLTATFSTYLYIPWRQVLRCAKIKRTPIRSD